MTLEEEFRLSCYEELTALDNKKQVYLVKEKSLGKILVKKEISCSHPEIYSLLKKDNIEGIPKIYEIILNGDTVIVIEEYIHGENLQTILEQRGYFREEEAAAICLKVCVILKQLHHQKPMMIHRDIKPSNIMLSYEGNLYLIDFNAARQYAEGSCQDTELIGTCEYAAPEQYGFRQTDARSDIYALGVTINKLVTGVYPHEKTIDGKLGKIIAKCIQMDPEQRYQTVEELEYDLKKEEEMVNLPALIQPCYPPGFRTGIWWKKITALIGYGLCAVLFFTMEIEDTTGLMLTGSKLWYERLMMLVGTILMIFYCCNYCGILDRILGRFRKKRILFRLLQAATTLAGYVFWVAILVLIEGILW